MLKLVVSAVGSSALILLSISLTLLGAELFARASGYLPTVSHPWLIEPQGKARTPDRNLIVIDPSFLEPGHYDVDPGRPTLVALGDSFTAGTPVSEQFSYPSVLAGLLAEQGIRVNVVNMGMGDSSPDQHLRLFKHYVLPNVKPDVLVWAFYANDIGDNWRLPVYSIQDDSLRPINGARHWLWIRHSLHWSIPLPPRVKESSPLLRTLYLAIENVGKPLIREKDREADLGKSTRKLGLAMAEMNRLARVHDFRVYYVNIAPQSLYVNAAGERLRYKDSRNEYVADLLVSHYQMIAELLGTQRWVLDARFESGDLPQCNTERRATNATLVASDEIFAGPDRDGNLLGDRHFNEAGYELLAQSLARCLQAGDWRSTGPPGS